MTQSQSRKFPGSVEIFRFNHLADLDKPVRDCWLLFRDVAYLSDNCLRVETAPEVAFRVDCQIPKHELANKRRRRQGTAKIILRTLHTLLAGLAIVLEPKLPASSLKVSPI